MASTIQSVIDCESNVGQRNLLDGYKEESVLATSINCEDGAIQNIVDEYPEEMPLMIFGFLGSASLKNITLVNKR